LLDYHPCRECVRALPYVVSARWVCVYASAGTVLLRVLMYSVSDCFDVLVGWKLSSGPGRREGNCIPSRRKPGFPASMCTVLYAYYCTVIRSLFPYIATHMHPLARILAILRHRGSRKHNAFPHEEAKAVAQATRGVETRRKRRKPSRDRIGFLRASTATTPRGPGREGCWRFIMFSSIDIVCRLQLMRQSEL
jgi:hypothetical protein